MAKFSPGITQCDSNYVELKMPFTLIAAKIHAVVLCLKVLFFQTFKMFSMVIAKLIQ